ncbi:hypothetical protein MWG46_04045 [Escherichia coli]|nr:hypothetical protein [Escherichia coli]
MAKGKTTTLTVALEPESATDKTSGRFPPIHQKPPLVVKDMTITVNGRCAGKVSIRVIR